MHAAEMPEWAFQQGSPRVNWRAVPTKLTGLTRTFSAAANVVFCIKEMLAERYAARKLCAEVKIGWVYLRHGLTSSANLSRDGFLLLTFLSPERKVSCFRALCSLSSITCGA